MFTPAYPGRARCRPVVVSAHLDTVFPYGTDLQVQREADQVFGPGIGDNSLGLAGLFGLLWALRQKDGQDDGQAALPGDVWLVANVGEEGLGDLRGMRAVVDRFGESACAYLILEGMALGQIYYRGLGVQRYRITVNTDGRPFLGGLWQTLGDPRAGQSDRPPDGPAGACPAALFPECWRDCRRHQRQHHRAGSALGVGSALRKQRGAEPAGSPGGNAGQRRQPVRGRGHLRADRPAPGGQACQLTTRWCGWRNAACKRKASSRT